MNISKISSSEFYDQITHIAPQLEEMATDLYALESMITLARDADDLRLYHIHCRRLEASIYTLHEKIGSWQQLARQRAEEASFQNDRFLTQAIFLTQDYIRKVLSAEEKIMRLQQMISDQKRFFELTTTAALAHCAARRRDQITA